MKKIILLVFIFVMVAALVSLAFALFFAPHTIEPPNLRYQECVLLQNIKTNQIDCFGCHNNICKDASADWIFYENKKNGINYSCNKTEQGCQLAQ